MIGRLLRVIGLCLAVPAVSAWAADETYVDELIMQARAKRLSERVEWLRLLHYEPYSWRLGRRSLADDPRFFNAPNGKVDPVAELDATLRAFFSDRPETDKQQNPQCAFIARYHWLKQELGFDPTRLPPQRCARFEQWRERLNPGVLTLVFPAAYLNNPASLYGHTLLRIDAKDHDDRTRLLSYAINYAAATDETSGIVFAARGLFGGYPGLFAIAPYYIKVTEYNDLENRDIWEYELNFTEAEIDRLLMHVWELGPIRFDYYFFDENCSYHLLSLFEVARPDLRLTEQFKAWAIPADTVRAVVQQQGLLRRVTYRPARSTTIRTWQERMPNANVELARALASGELEPAAPAVQALPETERARILELAFEYLEYQRLASARPGVEPSLETSRRLRALLVARAAVGAPSPPPVPTPAVRPDEGHGSARIGIGVGRSDGARFTELRLRPAYHDIYDPEEGYNRGAQIEFFNLALRQTEDQEGIRLERLDLIDITSLSPRDGFFRPRSWNVAASVVRQRFADGSRPLVFRVGGGAGAAYEPIPGTLLYGTIDTAFDVGSNYDAGYAVGIGPALGALIDIGPRARLGLYGRALRYGWGDDHDAREMKLVQTYNPSRQMQWRIELGRAREFDHAWNSAALFWNLYF